MFQGVQRLIYQVIDFENGRKSDFTSSVQNSFLDVCTITRPSFFHLQTNCNCSCSTNKIVFIPTRIRQRQRSKSSKNIFFFSQCVTDIWSMNPSIYTHMKQWSTTSTCASLFYQHPADNHFLIKMVIAASLFSSVWNPFFLCARGFHVAIWIYRHINHHVALETLHSIMKIKKKDNEFGNVWRSHCGVLCHNFV